MKKILIAFLALVMCISVCLAAFPGTAYAKGSGETTIGEDQEELKRLEKELEKIKQARSSSSSAASQAGKQYDSTEDKMAAIQLDIDLLMQEQEITNGIISSYDGVIERLKDSIDEQTVTINSLYDSYDVIVINYYKYGEPSALELLVSSGSLAEYLTKKDYVSYILQSMEQKEQEIEAATIDLENTYSMINEAYDSLEGYLDDLGDTLQEQQDRLEELNDLLEELKNDKTIAEQQAASYSAQQEELQKKIKALKKTIEEKKAYIDPSFCWPIDSVYWKNCYISSGYGYRKDPFTGEKRFHRGVDIAAPYGTPVQVVKNGTVVESTDNGGSSGIYIKVDHHDGSYTLYAHLSKRLVKVGAKVMKGQIIGKVGSTGRSTGNHLHFMVYEGSEIVNPKKYLDKYILKALDIHHYFD